MADNVLQVHLKHPEWPIIKISKLVGVDHSELSVQLCGISQLDRPTGGDGKKRPASEKQAEQQRQTIQSEIAEHPEKSDSKTAQADECGSGNYLIEIQRCNSCIVESPKVYSS